jgi:hypothetical protein
LKDPKTIDYHGASWDSRDIVIQTGCRTESGGNHLHTTIKEDVFIGKSR